MVESGFMGMVINDLYLFSGFIGMMSGKLFFLHFFRIHG